MAMRQFADMRHDDDQLYDMEKRMPEGYEAPEYPMGLSFSVTLADLAKAGGGGGMPGHTMRFSAMGDVTSVYHGMDSCRIELELNEFAGEDGKFFDLERPSHLSLTGEDCAKMELDTDAELGDMIHLIGSVRLDSLSKTEYGECACLQITDLTFEDESAESRDG